MKQGRKQLLEFGPLLVFFLVNWKAGIFWATGIFMVTILAVLLYTFVTTGKVAKVPLATAILVGVFGGLTLYLHDETFIKDVMGEALSLPDSAWRTLSLRWGIFFGALALLNEAVWRNFTTDQWVTFKVFGQLGLTLVFALANAPFMARHMHEEPAPAPEKPSVDG